LEFLRKTEEEPIEKIPVGSVEEHGYIVLNELVAYEKLRHSGVVRLHFSETEAEKLSDKDKALFFHAMATLASEIRHDDETQLIEAPRSWIVAKLNPYFFEYGFTFIKSDIKDTNGKKTAEAAMFRNKFLDHFRGK